MKTTLRILLLLMAASLLAAGCSDDEEKGDNDVSDLSELSTDTGDDTTDTEDDTADDTADTDDASDVSDSSDAEDTADDSDTEDADDTVDASDMGDAQDTEDMADTEDMDMMEMPCGDGTCDATESQLSPGDMDYCPSDCGVMIIFELDATGNQIALPALTNPPPPGMGTAFIVGNQDPWGPWMPNTAALADDGMAPDPTAGDNIWAAAWVFDVGTTLEYKYTIGLQGDDWTGTEEYMAGNNRGYTIPNDGSAIIRISDVFADEPASAGGQGSLTTITVEAP